ncbi:hypothetical protein [Streptomyces sp. NPDC051572]|uniref:hypothetical protein n=1 Tax=unclassified Streptomyces TaxID=2593676 RepID=UPI0034502A83
MAGLHSGELAVLAGVGQSYCARLEQGQSTAGPEFPEVIAQAAELTPLPDRPLNGGSGNRRWPT